MNVRSAFSLLCLFCLLTGGRISSGAESPEVRAAIDRGTDFLKRQIASQHGGHRSLTALALLKAGVPLDTPELQAALKETLGRCVDGKYVAVDAVASVYAAGVDATLLAEIDGKKYQSELQTIANYLQGHQQENGGWDYPDVPPRAGMAGDTSVTQYACLGLWAVERAGIPVDPGIWVRVLNWHSKFQNMDGGYSYTPSNTMPGAVSTVNMSINAIGSLHIAMLHLSPGFQPITQNLEHKPVVVEKKFGILEAVPLEDKAVPRKPSISEESVKAARKAFSYVTARYTPLNDETSEFKAYYLYSLERMAALANVTKLGERDWYKESSEALLKVQQPDGAWHLSQDSSGRDTAFCVLFLTKATAKALNRRQIEPGFGEGMLAGGRGLPDDLLGVQYDGRNIKSKNQPVPPLDKLLAALQSTGEINLDEVQGQLVEQIQMGDRQSLVGQIDLLKRLAVHPGAETRRTAIWAIGRSDRMDLGEILIRSLDDPDLGVMIEARNALCWLSKKANGFGETEDPLAGLPSDASAVQRADAIAAWHRSLVLNWGKWYLEARPYALHGDAFEAEIKRKMAKLRLEQPAPAQSR